MRRALSNDKSRIYHHIANENISSYFLLSKWLHALLTVSPQFESLVNWLFIKWKWTYILDYEPWNCDTLNMGFVDKAAITNGVARFFLKLSVASIIFRWN